MKKTALVFFLMLTGLCVFAQSGVIRDISGTVELKAPGASSYVTAKNGDVVSQDTVISTGFKSNALVEVGSTLITVRPLTRLSLTEIRSSAGAETLNVNLQAGRVRVDVNPPAGTRAIMAVSSPIATASVRGTSFEFDTRNIRVNHGQVSFRGNRGSLMMVNEGSFSRVERNGRVADPISAQAEGLVPKSPVGADKSGSKSASKSVIRNNGIIAINLNYTLGIPAGF